MRWELLSVLHLGVVAFRMVESLPWPGDWFAVAQDCSYRCKVFQSTQSLHYGLLNSNNVKLSGQSYKCQVVVCLIAIVLCSVLFYTGLSQEKLQNSDRTTCLTVAFCSDWYEFPVISEALQFLFIFLHFYVLKFICVAAQK